MDVIPVGVIRMTPHLPETANSYQKSKGMQRFQFFFATGVGCVRRSFYVNFSTIRLHVSKQYPTLQRATDGFSYFEIRYSKHPRIFVSQFSRIRRNSLNVKYAYRFLTVIRKGLRFTLQCEQPRFRTITSWHGNVAPSLSMG
jgi:hypothetical protein